MQRSIQNITLVGVANMHSFPFHLHVCTKHWKLNRFSCITKSKYIKLMCCIAQILNVWADILHTLYFCIISQYVARQHSSKVYKQTIASYNSLYTYSKQSVTNVYVPQIAIAQIFNTFTHGQHCILSPSMPIKTYTPCCIWIYRIMLYFM